jgi:hypothetical protein
MGSGRCPGRPPLIAITSLRLTNRKLDAQYGLARPGVDADLADMTLHDDAARNVKTRAGALANVLCRIEGFERARGHLPGDAWTGVADFDHNLAVLSPRRDPQRA